MRFALQQKVHWMQDTLIHQHLKSEVTLLTGKTISLPDRVVQEAAYLLALDAVGVRDSTKIKTTFNSFVAAEQLDCPELKAWTGRERRAWLAAARWELFPLFDCVTLRCAWLTAALNQIDTARSAERVFKRYALDESYASLYMAFVDDASAVSELVEACEVFRDPAVMRDFTLNHTLIQAQAAIDFKRFNLWAAARAKASHKLSFVVKYSGVSRDDLANDLLTRAMGYYYRARPFKHRLHAANVAKAAMDGGVQQMLAYYTDTSRARIVADGTDGYKTTIVPLTPNSVGGEHDDSDSTSEDGHIAYEVENMALAEFLTGNR